MSTQEQALTSPVDTVLAQISIAMHQWSEEQLGTIEKTVRDRLDRHSEEVLMKLMGFSRDFQGRWEIDHCNGRGGNSNISDFLKSSQEAAVKEWLTQIELPKMSPAFKTKIKEDLRRIYENEINSKVYGMARARAQSDLVALLDTVLPATLVDKHLRMQKLLNPSTEPN